MGLAAAAVVAWGVAHIPVQVSDCVGNLLIVQHGSYADLFGSVLFSPGYIRPLAWVQFKVAYDLSQGQYWLTFKAIHIGQLVAMSLLFIRLLRVRALADVALVPLALLVLFGLHTFSGLVREAYPVNGYFTIVVAVLAAMCLTVAPYRWINDLLLVVLYVFALFTVESGLLVLVAVMAARMAGLKGVSLKALLGCLFITAGYMYLRFGPFGVGTPGLVQRSSGYGFSVLDPSDLVARFGAQPIYFYAYNVAASILTVLLSEPRGGVWAVVKRVVTGDDIPPWMIVNVLASVLATLVVTWFGVRAFGRWWRGQASEDDRLAWVALGVFTANAVLCYAYTKSVMMSVGGICFALLVFIALRDLAAGARDFRWTVRVPLLVIVLMMSSVWAVRAAGLPVLLREEAFTVRNDWGLVYPWLAHQRIDISAPESKALVEILRREALTTPIPNPWVVSQTHLAFFDLD